MRTRLALGVTLTVLLAVTPGCGGGDDAAKGEAAGSHECFTVTPDSTAAALGAFSGKQTQCNRTTWYKQQTASDGAMVSVADVVISGEAGGNAVPGRWASSVDLEMIYADTAVAPAAFHESDRCGLAHPSVKVTLGYEAYDPSDGVYAAWACKTCGEPTATFDLSITSVEGHAPANIEDEPLTRNTIHGTLHAVCAPSATPSPDSKAGAGTVTIDGPF
jgi:hypothetical protein